jgi:hypothetical protein
MMFEVRIVFVWWSNGINGNTGGVRRHVGDGFEFIDCKPVSCEIRESHLGMEDG